MKLITLALFYIYTVVAFAADMPDDSRPKVYALYQQYGSSCHLHPFLNYQKLTKIRNREGGELIFRDSDYQSRFVGYVTVFPAQRAWQIAMTKLYEMNGHFAQYQNYLATKGIISSQIYTADNKLFSEDTYNPLESIRRKVLTPFHFMDLTAEGIGGVKQILPMFAKDGFCLSP